MVEKLTQSELIRQIEDLRAEISLLKAENAMWQHDPLQPVIPRARYDVVLQQLKDTRYKLEAYVHDPGKGNTTMVALANDNRELIEEVKRLRKKLTSRGVNPDG